MRRRTRTSPTGRFTVLLTTATALAASAALTACGTEEEPRSGQRNTPDGEQASASACRAEGQGGQQAEDRAGEWAAPPAPDFNGDGLADLAIPAHLSTVDDTPLAGAISVVHGSESGPDTANAQVISRASEGELGELLRQTGFLGRQTLARDLDGDGFTDLLATVSITSDESDESDETWVPPHVAVLWGSPDGLSSGVLVEGGQVWGGDVDGDGHTDLLVSTQDGLAVRYGPFTRDGEPSREDSLGDSFGDSNVPGEVMVGDLTGDGRDDVVTSQGFEEMQYKAQFYAGGEDGVALEPTTVEVFSDNGIVADLDGDGDGDLAVRDVGEVSEDQPFKAGEVEVLCGSPTGPIGPGTALTSETVGLPGDGGEWPEEDLNGDGRFDDLDELNQGDQFGSALAAGDVNGDGLADLAVGIPGTNANADTTDTGAVALILGGEDGPSGDGARVVDQDTEGVPDDGELTDRFGSAVWLGDMNGDGHPELAVGAYGETGNGTPDNPSGRVWILHGTPDGPSTETITSFGPADLGAPDHGSDGNQTSQYGTHFGRSFAQP
ncbi:FG-GAP-like repeat-containing protein [Streptomyces sp. 4N509B]|uniref:FG-GAP-like repeat-containing protein n=1 Tax=Streptomyces sp. 4N509B TaxID=3457413 RepID=UPI003FD0F15D